jgi:uncharacterized damage-inducible protein DinB
MSAGELLFRMLRYQAWANEEILEGVKELDTEHHAEERHIALRLMNHCLVVNKIFAAHLVGDSHGFAADNTPETPKLEALRAEMAALDRWYLDYVKTVTPAQLSQSIPFAFTDGDKGYMTREEMLTHVVTHGGYHRGEVGRVLKEVAASSGPNMKLPWDTYAVHLHRTEPERRLQGRVETASANA